MTTLRYKIGEAKEIKKKLKMLSEVGFEPTPSLEDQNLSLAP
jgi:hypothetical protein